jgi:hypothetical protein
MICQGMLGGLYTRNGQAVLQKKEEIMIFSFWEIEEGVEVRVKDGNRRS